MDGGQTHFWLGDGITPVGFTATTAPSVGDYDVMGFTWGSGVLNQYLNDLNNGQSTYTVTPADGGTPLRIGSRDDLVTQLKGDVAEVLIYQPALLKTGVHHLGIATTLTYQRCDRPAILSSRNKAGALPPLA